MYIFYIKGLVEKGYVKRKNGIYSITPKRSEAYIGSGLLDVDWYKIVKSLDLDTTKMWLHYRKIRKHSSLSVSYANGAVIDLFKKRYDLVRMNKQIPESLSQDIEETIDLYNDVISDNDNTFYQRNNSRNWWDGLVTQNTTTQPDITIGSLVMPDW